jgi:kynurenine 3-monooxygenase
MQNEKILIIGAGLCGTMLALRMAQRGYTVELREKRPDMRKTAYIGGRSINLALSNRGLKALELVGLREAVLAECIPMNGRMIHGTAGELRFSKYSGRSGEHINSVSRGGLNIALLNAAEQFEHLTVHFESDCTGVDLDTATAHFKNADGSEEVVSATVVIGTDGAGSAVRRALAAQPTTSLFSYSQQFLSSGYKELSIPPTSDGGFRIEKNALHIWPRGKFMMIALPNLDGSFTVTLFHPYEGEAGFNTLDTPEKVQVFFEKYYPDALTVIPNLADEYFNNPVGTLGTIKCFPWQAKGKALIMGDAAHAIVPFYGQGMNASFEDVRVFDELLEQHTGDWAQLFEAFQAARAENTNAIADLAIDNFYEMQDKVADPVFIKKRNLETQLEQTYPEYFSKYSLVTFNENMPYSEAMRRGRLQDEVLMKLCSEKETPTLDDAKAALAEIGSFPKTAAPLAKVLADKAQPLGNYPHVRRVGNFIYVSGTSSRRADNTHEGVEIAADGSVSLDIRKQTKAVIENIGTLLQSMGAGLSDVIDVTTFLVDMQDFKGYNEVYGTFFNHETGPTRTTVAVHQLPHPNLLIEIKAIAFVNDEL